MLLWRWFGAPLEFEVLCGAPGLGGLVARFEIEPCLGAICSNFDAISSNFFNSMCELGE